METKNIYDCAAGIWQAPATGNVIPFDITPKVEVAEIILEGIVLFKNNNTISEFKRGTVFWHIEGEKTIHQFKPGHPYKCLVIHFNVSARERSIRRISRFANNERLEKFLKETVSFSNDMEVDRKLWSRHLYNYLLWECSYGNKFHHESQFPDELLCMINGIVKEPGKFHNAQTITKIYNISKSAVYRLFQQYLQCPPYDFIIRQKIKYSLHMLADNSVCIKEIAEKCGFANIESFYRAFKRIHGITPGEYRAGIPGQKIL